MQSSSESEVRTPRLFLTQNGACFMSPHLLPTDPGIDTPNKLPAAPHPSPINMDIGQLNPESKEIFRAQLLKACQLKIPDAIEKSFGFDESVLGNLSYTESASPESKHIFTSLGKESIEKNVCSEDKVAEVDGNVKIYYDKFQNDWDENSNFKEIFPHVENFSSKFNYDFVKNEKSRSDRPQITFTTENGAEQFSEQFQVNRCLAWNAKQHEFAGSKNFRQDAEFSHCEISVQNGNDMKYPSGDVDPNFTTYPRIKAQFIDMPPVPKEDPLASMKPVEDDKEQSYRLNFMSVQDRSVFYDSTTNRVDLSLLIDPNTEWNDSSSYRSRSPCSDKLSTVAQCASDASDISDIGEFEEDYESTKDFESSKEIRSKSFGSSKDFGSTKDCRPKKKQSENLVIRRFLRWRRCFKLRKKAASLDESKFPFLANRFDSYKTEFELSV